MAYEVVTVGRVTEAIALVTLNRPDALNAMNARMFGELGQALDEAEADEAVRVVVFAGAGGKAFSSGYDVKELASFTPEEQRSDYVQRDLLLERIVSFRKPTIAAINGLAYGGGALLAMACDIRVGGPNSGFKITAVSYNGVTGTWGLPLIVGDGLAKEWLLTGRMVTPAEAQAHGLLNHLVDDEAVVDKALEIAGQIAANPPAGAEAVKFLINDHTGRRRADALRAETAYMLTYLPPGKITDLFAKFFAKTRR